MFGLLFLCSLNLSDTYFGPIRNQREISIRKTWINQYFLRFFREKEVWKKAWKSLIFQKIVQIQVVPIFLSLYLYIVRKKFEIFAKNKCQNNQNTRGSFNTDKLRKIIPVLIQIVKRSVMKWVGPKWATIIVVTSILFYETVG